MAAAEITEKQRRAMETIEGAPREGLTLSGYARAHGVELRELYDSIAALRRKGLLPMPAKRKSRNRFVALRVTQQDTSTTSERTSTPVCQVVHPSGCVVECWQWPPSSWLATVSAGAGAVDAAS